MYDIKNEQLESRAAAVFSITQLGHPITLWSIHDITDLETHPVTTRRVDKIGYCD
jgi:hypothetical protein